MPTLSRRELLTTGAGLAAGAAFGFAKPEAAGRFDLAGQPHTVFEKVHLHAGSVMQGFAFDSTNNHVYTAQVADTAAADEEAGNLTITRVDLADPHRTGAAWMLLKGFGHGASIAVEPAGTGAYLWVEIDNKVKTSDGKKTGRGTRITRFRFSAGKTLTRSSAGLPHYLPVTGAEQFTPGIDPVNNRLFVRCYRPAVKAFDISVFDLTRARAGDFGAPIYRNVPMPTPKVAGTTTARLAQGWAVLGRYGYYLTGRGEDASGHTSDPPRLLSFDLEAGGAVVQDVPMTAGSGRKYREPEGLSIWLPAGGKPARLAIGLASGTHPGKRMANLYYLDSTT
ncbi:hypothetical protein [Fodinicola acaciae]|uniref:phage baseplate protein n=1 Tax=Fodinicola acaciae TaxID=2681555 RepID=UPI0013D7D365|nr:hypothetical protein [Fodinicola acaciae]